MHVPQGNRWQTSSGAPQQEGNVATNVLKMRSYCFRCKNRINAETQQLLEAQLKSNLGKQTKTPTPSASPSLFLWHQGIFGFRFSFRTLWPLAERKSHGSVDIFILSQCERKQFVQVGFSGISADLPRRTLKRGTGSNREVQLMPLSCNGGALGAELYQSYRDSRSSVFS